MLGRIPGEISISDELAEVSFVRQNPYVLVVGTLEPRKGHAVLLDAFDRLFERHEKQCPALVIVGRPGWKTLKLQSRIKSHPEFGRRLFWFAGASDAMVDALYRSADGVVVPTYAEGYGLPLAEAATHAKKILARDLPVFREHDLPGVSYFRDDDAESLADKIVDWLGRDDYEATQRKPISWKDSSDALFGVLRTWQPSD